MKIKQSRPITGRPPFGEVRLLKGQPVRLVAYINNNAWYHVPLHAYNMPPKREWVSYHDLPLIKEDDQKNILPD